VFPNINTNDRDVRFEHPVGDECGKGKKKERNATRTEQRILVRRRDNLQLLRLCTIPEPAPTTPLNASGGRVERLLECVDGSKVALERRLQLAVFELATALLNRGEILPEERVIYVAYVRSKREREVRGWWMKLTSAVELERWLKSDPLVRGGGLGVRLLGGIETVHIGLMVLGIVKLHDFGRYVRLQGLSGVDQTAISGRIVVLEVHGQLHCTRRATLGGCEELQRAERESGKE